MEARRRIRISFSDPDATDSDSGEDSSTSASCGRKTKIVILHCSSSKNPVGGCGSQQKQASRSSSASCREERLVVGSASAPVMKRSRGVYERQPGRWAAEFRCHRLRARHWIGTFATEDDAKAAYDDFAKQFVQLQPCGHPPLPVPLPASLERGGRAAAGVHRASHRQQHSHPPETTEKRQIVQALPAAGIVLPPLPSAPPRVSSSTSAASPPPPLVMPAPPTPFENAQLHVDALPSVHQFWADDPADEDLVGLADLGHLPLPPFSDGSMDFDLADLSLFDGFL